MSDIALVFNKFENQLEPITPSMLCRNLTNQIHSFTSKRTAIHNRMVSKLLDFGNLIQKKQEKAIYNLGEVSRRRLCKVGPLCFDNNIINMKKRELVFINRKILELLIKKYNIEIYYYFDRINQVKLFLTLFSNDSASIPLDKAFRIIDKFFEIDFGQNHHKITNKIKSLTSRHQSIQNYLKNQHIPLWFTNFNKFFQENVKKNKEKMDMGISYAFPLEFENSISRAIFCQRTIQGAKIDQLVEKFSKLDIEKESEHFNNEVIDLCTQLIPPNIKRNGVEQNISLIIFYRIFFDRLYEKYSQKLIPDFSKSVEQLYDITKLQLKYFHIPKWFHLQPEDLEKPISEFFQNDQLLKETTLLIDESTFATNPIDALYSIHKSLLKIHKSGLIHGSNENNNSTHDENSKLLSFDDLFSLLIGVLLSSNLTDVFGLCHFLEKFAPKNCLSNPFEYAHAGITALVMHCKNLTADSLIKAFNEK
ncbi:hypothetical protein TRFO_19594 [Tritrichomonas foetus]|uniref:VPS9 domain-containing protein n=1 Tax=Tritrichomonas foetus TaxID=1144522 RepID=A0A1J4KNE7_9EUKA|nr:hypothetical protein TRFO_19594 [Tritrichomonas foetus]|eukprot:OHT10917.1 hypothetical protein TRFO_19594 [Tritrichomonas foetus]